ncbi:tyrosine-type recombinase/integrase [Candidatus Bathyarchaeota archaeon]|nr:tyrosine-type recombinase/integrase [Candidatus Bathyarchaeota archaeon]
MRDIIASKSITFWLNKGYAETTKENYRKGTRPFFEWAETHPDDLVADWKKVKYDIRLREQFIDEWTEKVEEYVFGLKDYTPRSQEQELTLIVSFFKSFKIPIEPDKPKHTYVRFHNRDLKRDEIQLILANTASLRDKLFFLMMAESGLRPYTLVQLRYEHVKEDFEANKLPMKIELPSELLKERVSARWTFIGDDSFKILKTYLKPKLPLKAKDQIFNPQRKGRMKGSFLDPVTFTNKFSRIVLKLGITEHRGGKPKKIRLYCLRKWFNNNCRYEGFDTSFKEYWMGHNTTQTAHISRDLERHKDEYSKAYQNLRIYKPAISVESIKEQETRIEELEKALSEQQKLTRELLQFRETLETLKDLADFLGIRDWKEYVGLPIPETMREAFMEWRKEKLKAKQDKKS